jgi:dinuclear metal center YbgI/SA1388 family protein
MKLHQIVQILDEISPFSSQADWDNSGLCVGDEEAEVEKIYLSLDADRETIEALPENSLLIIHHPPIFKGVTTLRLDSYPSSFLVPAIKKNIAIVAMHTNYDLSHLNRYVLEEVLGYALLKEEGHLCYFEVDCSFYSFALEVAQKLEIENLSVVAYHDSIKTAALCTGSGMDLMRGVEADCFLTGDIKYHDAKEAYERGLSLIDIKHYESERFFALSLQKELQKKGLNGIIANSKNPFSTISKDRNP